MAGPHDRIIAEAAGVALRPLSFVRKGRSRTRLADHGWWLTVVEFQPSAWSKGSYLNVAAHWLWSEMGHLSFDYGNRVAEFVEYQSDEQFMPTAARLSDMAAQEARRLAQTFTSLNAAADVLTSEVQRTHEPAQGSWMAYNAGVAAALAGRTEDAAAMFSRNLSEPSGNVLHDAAERLAPLANDQRAFHAVIVERIARQREALRLPRVEELPI